jgi:hypothetical protein
MKKFIIILILLCVLTNLSLAFFNIHFGETDYWSVHGFFLLVFLAFFPRLTLLFSSIPFGGLLWWLGFIFCPHYLVAILATLNYGHTNPILVTLSWIVALGAESSEKYIIHRQVRRRYYKRGEVIDVEAHEIRS